jgi:integrase
MLGLSWPMVILLKEHLTKEQPSMTTSDSTAGPRILVAIDIGKAKHVVLVELPTGKRRKMIVRNQLSDFRQLAGYLKRLEGALETPVEAAHYVFASFKPVGRFNGREVIGSRMTKFDPTTPIGSWKKAWRKLTKDAGLSGLRFHDLRHHAITELLTNPNISIQTTKSIAGHVSQRMVDRYAHIRLEAKRNALESLSRKHAQVKVMAQAMAQNYAAGSGNSKSANKSGRRVRI